MRPQKEDTFVILFVLNIIYAILVMCFFKKLKEGGDMAQVKKAKCAAKTTKGTKCKNTVSGKSKFCATHKKK